MRKTAMGEPNQSLKLNERERVLAVLAERDAGLSGGSLSEADEATLVELKSELDTLVTALREPPPLDEYEAESDCQRAVELVESMGRPSDAAASREFGDREPMSDDIVEFERLGPYEVTAKLGEGGMGAVYKAVHPRLKRTVAIKVLPARRMNNAASIARFQREMEAIGALNHPNIVTAHDAGEDAGMHYLVMEYVDGIDLSTLVRRVGPLAPADACEIVRQAACGLAEASARGIVHRDVKPSNLMLAAAQNEAAVSLVKILDFGLARLSPLHADGHELTTSGLIMGTLKYMAPEQCSQSHDVDVRADIYSLGATLYKLLCGVSPFSDERFDSPLALLAALGSEEPPRLTTRRPDVPPQLAAIVHRMIAKKPAERFASPSEVVEALTPWAQGADLAGLLVRANGVPEKSLDGPSVSAICGRASEAALLSSQLAEPPRSLPHAVLLGAGALLALVAGLLLLKSFDATDGVAAKHRATSGDPIDHPRTVAEWLIAQRAECGVTTLGGEFMNLRPGEQLPDNFLQLITANIEGNTSLSNEDFARFDKLPLFTVLNLRGTNINDAGLSYLGELPQLQLLILSETAVTDAGLEQLQRYPQLEALHLTGTLVTDAGLVHLGGHSMLYDLSLVGCRITDDGLTHLTGLKRLQIVALNRTGVTPRGVVTLQQSLPDCEIRSDYTQEEVAEAREAIPKSAQFENQ